MARLNRRQFVSGAAAAAAAATVGVAAKSAASPSTSPARRYMTQLTNEEITKKTPEKSLLSPKKRGSGRNVYGRITVRHRGGGAKRMLRDVDFRREKIGIPAVVAGIEYDPGRSARIVLNGATIGQFGELHPREQQARKLRQPVYLAEINLERLYRGVDFAWALDLEHTDHNSRWLMPCRFYEAGHFGVPCLAVHGFEVGTTIENHRIGCTNSLS